MKKPTFKQLQALARLGAVARLEQLQAEINALHAMFPELLRPSTAKPKRKQLYTKARPHWTQRPENKAKVKALGRKGARTRKALQENG